MEKKPLDKKATALVIAISLFAILLLFGYFIFTFYSDIKENHPTLLVLTYIYYAFLLIYGILLFVFLYRRVKRQLPEWVDRNEFTKRLYEDYGYRTFVFAILCEVASLSAFIYYLVIGIANDTRWLRMLAGYYLFFFLVRLFVILATIYILKNRKEDSIKKNRDEAMVMVIVGSLMLVMEIYFIAPLASHYINEGLIEDPTSLTVITTLVFVVRFFLAVRGLRNARKYQNGLVTSVRYLNFSGLIVSFFSFVLVLAYYFEEPFESIITYAILAASLLAFFMAIHLINKGIRERKKYR